MPRKTYKLWSKQEEILLEEMRMKGKTIADISEATGHSFNGVAKKIQQMAYPKIRARAIQYIELFRQGLSKEEVAEVTGVSLRSIRCIVYRLKKAGHELGPTAEYRVYTRRVKPLMKKTDRLR